MTVSNRTAPKKDVRRVPGETGVWVLVLGDMTIFAIFFAAFMYSRGRNLENFATDHTSLSIPLGTLNTALLLTSSLLVVLAVSHVNAGRRTDAPRLISWALACGLSFIVVKTVEWTHLFSSGIAVGSGEYFSYYFVCTGIHLAHVIVGCIVLSRMNHMIRRPLGDDREKMLFEAGGVFWHMVDLLWIMLFALFYVVR